MKLFLKIVILLASLILVALAVTYPTPVNWLSAKFSKKASVQERLAQYKADVVSHLEPLFTANNISFPPKHVTLLFLKDLKVLRLYAGEENSSLKLIKEYPVLAASGKEGPKLKEGDRQVPEGVYQIEALNPNSLYHLSLRVNYPNAFDQEMAKQDQRTNLGGDIMIHGDKVSIGCVAIGNSAIEEVFVLAAFSNYQNWHLIFAPTDLRVNSRKDKSNLPKWINLLDEKIFEALKKLP